MWEYTGMVTEVSLESNPNYLVRLRRIVGRLARSAGMDSREILDAKLAITEACANAIRHGSPEGQAGRVTIKLSTNGGTVVAEVTDGGKGFDPADLHLEASAESGGFGIPLMTALADKVEFIRNGKGMTVRLVKMAKRPGRVRRDRG